MHEGAATSAALDLARLSHDILMDYGAAAKLAVDMNTVTPAVEKVEVSQHPPQRVRL
jgi:hypothetical protein